MDGSVWFALLVSALAGLSTTVGSLLGIIVRKPSASFMAFTLGFSAGVMVLVSFVELLQHGIVSVGFAPAHLAFFGAMVVMFLVEVAVPHDYAEEHHRTGEQRGPGEQRGMGQQRHRRQQRRNGQLYKTGLFTALGIAIHNVPEGMASFMGALDDPSLGAAIGVAIALHNIPEGLAVSVPIYAATGSHKKAFLWSFLSGASEPVGAVLAAFVVLPFLSKVVLGYMLAAVAGIMVFIALDELVPVSRSFGHEHISVVGIMAGMMVMAVSLWML